MAMSPRLLRPRATGFTPRNLPGLVAWFDADDASTFALTGTAVGEWRDKSGNGYSVSQSTAINQPARTGTIGGRACIDFDGTNDYLFSDGTGLGAAMSGDKATTTFIVGEMHNSSEWSINSQGTWVSWGSSASGNQFLYFRTATANSAPGINSRNDASVTQNNPNHDLPSGDGSGAGSAIDSFIYSASIHTISSALPSVSRVHTIMNGLGDGRTSAVPVNGSISAAAAGRSGAFTFDRFTVGSLGRNTFSDYFPARIAEVIVYSRVLSDSERARVLQWLGAKYKQTVFDQVIPTVSNADAQSWVNRVYSIGGTVSAATAAAVNTFATSIESAGLRSRLWRVNPMAGESLSAALVPLYRGPSSGGTQYGDATDTNDNFVSGDYVASTGLIGNGSTKRLRTGLPLNFNATRHIGFFAHTLPTATFRTYIGGTGATAFAGLFRLSNGSPVTNYGLATYNDASGAGGSSGTPANAAGDFVLGTHGDGAATAMCYTNGALSGTAGVGRTSGTVTTGISVFAEAQGGGTLTAHSNARLGGYTIGDNLSESQALAYYNIWDTLVRALGRK